MGSSKKFDPESYGAGTALSSMFGGGPGMTAYHSGVVGKQNMMVPRSMIAMDDANEEIYPRSESAQKKLDALALDIRKRGIEQPLILYKKEDGRFGILAGHQRYLANELAIQRYSDYNGETLPAIIESAPKGDGDYRIRLILNNIQRDKTSYERMMEIVVFCREYPNLPDESCLKNESGEKLTTRAAVCMSLGCSDSEVTRYLKIHNDLIPELMPFFANGQISTAVAHSIAKQLVTMQEFVYESWDFSDPEKILTGSILSDLITKKALKDADSAGEGLNEQKQKKKPEKPIVEKPVTIQAGIEMLGGACAELSQMSSSFTRRPTKREERRLINQIAAEMVKIQMLKNQLASFVSEVDE